MSYRMTKTHEKRHLMGAPSDSAKGRRYQVTSDTALSFRLAHEAVVFLGQENSGTTMGGFKRPRTTLLTCHLGYPKK